VSTTKTRSRAKPFLYAAPATSAWLLGGTLVAAIALYLHARWYGFVCDDAYISLRYARNFAQHGVLEYNLGERVEGYTNFLYVLLAGVLWKLGLETAGVVTALGVVALVLLVGGCAATAWLTSTAGLRRREPWWLVAPTLLVAASSSVAAWLFSGLETILFSGFLVVGTALSARSTSRASARWMPAVAGACLGLATLTRPEGIAYVGLAASLVALNARGTWKERGLRAGLVLLGAFVLVGPHLLFRRAYYGELVPNTYFLKTSGNRSELAAGGLRYARLALRSFSPHVLLLWALTLVPVPAHLPEPVVRRRRVVLWLARVAPAIVVAEAVLSGGDFLGLWRFFAPVVPLVALGGALGLSQLVTEVQRRLRERFQGPVARARLQDVSPLAAALVLALSVMRIEPTWRVWNDPGSKFPQAYVDARIEPTHWTGSHGQHWYALGAWIAERARPGDTMAIGAAGAAPFAAGIPNLDILGLCDAYVAKHGDVVGSRPGHQRRAKLSWVLEKHPTFLFWDDGDYVGPHPLHYEARWAKSDYLWVEADLQIHGGAVHHFLLDRTLAESLRGTPHVRVAEIPPGAEPPRAR